nr:transposase [Alistipes finegoldii]
MSMPAHVHILVEIPSPTDFAKIINKVKSSTGVVYRKYPEYADFSGWAAGFDSFSVSFNDLNRVKHHIEKQETVHQELSFEDEYDQLLEENGFNAYQDFMRASFSAYAAVNNHIKNKRK